MKGALKPDAAAEMIPEGASLMIGGFMAVGTPERMVDAIVARGVGGLTQAALAAAVGISQSYLAGLKLAAVRAIRPFSYALPVHFRCAWRTLFRTMVRANREPCTRFCTRTRLGRAACGRASNAPRREASSSVAVSPP